MAEEGVGADLFIMPVGGRPEEIGAALKEPEFELRLAFWVKKPGFDLSDPRGNLDCKGVISANELCRHYAENNEVMQYILELYEPEPLDFQFGADPIEVRITFRRRVQGGKSQPDRWISSKDACARLAEMEERRWAEWGRSGRPITPAGLARLLSAFDIKPVARWIDGRVVRGYWASQFTDAWQRYLAR